MVETHLAIMTSRAKTIVLMAQAVRPTHPARRILRWSCKPKAMVSQQKHQFKRSTWTQPGPFCPKIAQAVRWVTHDDIACNLRINEGLVDGFEMMKWTKDQKTDVFKNHILRVRVCVCVMQIEQPGDSSADRHMAHNAAKSFSCRLAASGERSNHTPIICSAACAISELFQLLPGLTLWEVGFMCEIADVSKSSSTLQHQNVASSMRCQHCGSCDSWIDVRKNGWTFRINWSPMNTNRTNEMLRFIELRKMCIPLSNLPPLRPSTRKGSMKPRFPIPRRPRGTANAKKNGGRLVILAAMKLLRNRFSANERHVSIRNMMRYVPFSLIVSMTTPECWPQNLLAWHRLHVSRVFQTLLYITSLPQNQGLWRRAGTP